MSKHLTFIGEPGPDAREMLSALRHIGLTGKREAPSPDLSSRLAADPPAAMMFDSDIGDLGRIIAAVREQTLLSEVPILVRLKTPDPNFLSEAFKWGVDDFYVDGVIEHFAALVSAIERQDTWETVRAPAGQIILAHPDRMERAKIGRILRRNGFDTYFAGNSAELEAAIQTHQARAVIASLNVPGTPVQQVVARLAGEMPATPPFVFAVKAEDIEAAREGLPKGIAGRIFEDGADAEGITFVLNEMLAPPPLGARRSPRVLYGTPARFVHQGGEKWMTGFTFNINHGGVYIRTLASLPLQTRIEVRFRPPYGRGEILAGAQVVWRKQLGDAAGAAAPPGMGIQFLDLWPADLAAYETGYARILERAETVTSIPTAP